MTTSVKLPRPNGPPPDQRSALEHFRDRLRSGVLGEDPARHSTWRLDRLWLAACKEANDLEMQAVHDHNARRSANR